jgi:hypothetical protein
MAQNINACKILVLKPKRAGGRPKCEQENNNKTDFREPGRLDLIHLSSDRNYRRDLVNLQLT